MTSIRVNRYQYGIGQGCFHVQEINLISKGEIIDMFRLVYDCGGNPKALNWSINHLTNQRNIPYNKSETKIDAFYLSHFEQDHLNGLKSLGEKAEIKRIFLPYIDSDDVLFLIMQQIYEEDSISAQYIQDLISVSSGGSIDGLDVPLIRIRPSADDRLGDINLDEVPLDADADLTHDLPATSREIRNQRFTIGLKLKPALKIWELAHWAYKPKDSAEIVKIVIEHLKKIPNFPANSIDGNWIFKHKSDIKKAYDSAIKEYNKTTSEKIKTNHNIVSLCLYSGPTNIKLRFYNSNKPHAWPFKWHHYFCDDCDDCDELINYKNCFCGVRKGAWLGTGDAMLARHEVWNSFKYYFTTHRVESCSSVLIPHHGAGSKHSQNYQPELVQPNRACVISAGAKNRYNHPHKDVILGILHKNGRFVLVNENDPIGFIEHLEYTT